MKTSKSSRKFSEVRGGRRSLNKVDQNTFQNTPEEDLDTFCNIISHIMSKYRPDFLGLQKLPDRTLTITTHILYFKKQKMLES